MEHPDSSATDPAQRLEADFARTFRPSMKRVIKPRTPEEVDAIAEGDEA